MFCSFREVAVATLQAMLEFNLFCPPGIADKPFETRKKVFEAFWASEEERIGDEREGSWSHWVVQRAAHLGTATTAKRQRSRWGDATQPVAVAPKPQDASKAVLESRSGTQAMEAAYETATKVADAVVGPQDADAAGGAAEVWGFLADPAADAGGQATTGSGDGQAGATPGVGNGAGSGAGAGGVSEAAAAPAGPVHGPELPPGPAVPDLPHGRVRIIDGRPMVYSIMHGYHLPLDETDEDSTAIYRQILGDEAAEQAGKRLAEKRRSGRSYLVDVPADDPYEPCTWVRSTDSEQPGCAHTTSAWRTTLQGLHANGHWRRFSGARFGKR